MKNFQDRANLSKTEEQKFIDACKAEFIETSLAATNRKKVTQLTAASYLPNVISAITAGFFVVYLLSGYTQTIALILGFLLLSVVAAVEAGKRGIIASLAKTYFVDGKAPLLAIVGLLACFALSMTASYIGGQQLVVETAPPPAREVTPQIDSLKAEVAAQQDIITRLQRTTWKGKITRTANQGINQAKAFQNKMYDRIAQLEAQDDEAHAATLLKHQAKHLNFGIVLGILAALADFFLLGLLWTAKKLKYQVAAANYQPGQTGSGQPPTSYQLPTISNNKAGLNQQQPRPIGFQLPQAQAGQASNSQLTGFCQECGSATEKGMRLCEKCEWEIAQESAPEDGDESPLEDTPTEKRTTEKRYNGKPLEDAQQPPEVVTVVEREVVELSDRVKDCQHCGQRFVYYNSRAKYCSTECRVAAWEARTGKKFGKRQKG